MTYVDPGHFPPSPASQALIEAATRALWQHRLARGLSSPSSASIFAEAAREAWARALRRCRGDAEAAAREFAAVVRAAMGGAAS